jgi:hypothetical protein
MALQNNTRFETSPSDILNVRPSQSGIVLTDRIHASTIWDCPEIKKQDIYRKFSNLLHKRFFHPNTFMVLDACRPIGTPTNALLLGCQGKNILAIQTMEQFIVEDRQPDYIIVCSLGDCLAQIHSKYLSEYTLCDFIETLEILDETEMLVINCNATSKYDQFYSYSTETFVIV